MKNEKVRKVIGYILLVTVCVIITPCFWVIAANDGAGYFTMPYSFIKESTGVVIAALFGGAFPALTVALSLTTDPFSIFISSVATLACSVIRKKNLCSSVRNALICAAVMSVTVNGFCFFDTGKIDILSYAATAVLWVTVFCTYYYFRKNYGEKIEKIFPVRKTFKNARVYRRISLKSELLIIINLITLLCVLLVSMQNDTKDISGNYDLLMKEAENVMDSLEDSFSEDYSEEAFYNENFISNNAGVIKESFPKYSTLFKAEMISVCEKDGDDYMVIDQCRVVQNKNSDTGKMNIDFIDTGIKDKVLVSEYLIDEDDENSDYSDIFSYFMNSLVVERNIDGDVWFVVKINGSLLSDVMEFFKSSFYVTISALIVINIFAAWYIDKRIAAPINRMTEAVSGFAYNSENERIGMREAFSALGINTGNEIEALYTAYEKTMSDMTDYIDDIHKKSRQIAKFQHNIIVTMADIIESRDENTGGHIKRTAAYVEIIARKLQSEGKFAETLTDNYINDMIVAAPLHDMGKIHVTDTILNKAGKLTDEEFAIMKTHTTAGRKILENATETLGVFSYLSVAIDMANVHHEWWNGKGYPEGKSGEEIPLCARIMAVADVFDALISKRCYKAAMPLEKAYSIIREETGTHFDPVISEAFFASTEEIEKALNEFDE